MTAIKSHIKTTKKMLGFLVEVALDQTWQSAGKSRGESIQHQNDFNGIEFSRNEFSRAGIFTDSSRNFTHQLKRRELPLLHQHRFSTTHTLRSNWARR
ncbi:hypothetical protein [Synechococcus sp. GEYO]|uniref:hypothetical protein n=1 Tax=Synechococcus sp. GEYO TaxID=2575511 RepID=UPI0010BDE6D8|nr:hypothetical protein [Synechococcus sp. GEYO]